MCWLFTSGGQSTEASASVLSMNIQDWFPLGLTGLICLQSKELSRVFSNTTFGKHQFFGAAQLSLWSNSHTHTWLLEKSQLWLYGSLSAKYLSINTLESVHHGHKFSWKLEADTFMLKCFRRIYQNNYSDVRHNFWEKNMDKWASNIPLSNYLVVKI